MSFSSSVKNEVARIKVSDKDEIISELSGMLPMCGSLKFNQFQEITLYFNTENASVARRIFTFLKNSYSENVEVIVSKSRQLKKNNIYAVTLKDTKAVKVLLNDLDFLRNENVFMPNYVVNSVLKNDHCKRAYIRGAFLGAGSITNPERSYHLELVSNNEDHARFLSQTINEFNLNSKIVKRKENYVIYLKEAEQISDFLTIIGAINSVLDFENIRVMKFMKNKVNRIVNCETANLNKTINASLKQVEDILYIKKTIGLENLPEPLREVAMLRVKNADSSLKEIGDMLEPPVGKSGINHRLNKIKKIASELRSEHNDYKNGNIK